MSRNKKSKLIRRRLFILGAMYCTTIALLSSRFYYLQVLCNSKYRTLSDSNRIKVLFIDPIRGRILDLHGRLLSTNKEFYNVNCDPENIAEPQSLMEKISSLFKLNKEQIETIKQKIKVGRIFVLQHNADWATLAAIEFNRMDLGGIYISKHYHRFYPYRHSCAHLVGYLGLTSDHRNIVNYYKGKTGLELTYEEELHGKPGILQHEVNSRGIVVRELTNTASVNGEDVQTSVDAELQHYIYNLFGGRKGSAVVINTQNGNVVALCSSPGYDNNQFISGFSKDEWQSLRQDPRKCLMNRALSLQIPPGSIFKIVSALSALKSSIIEGNTLLECTGHVIVGQRKFHCWKKAGHGKINLVDAIAQSCNAYFYQLGQILDIDELADTASTFGLGKSFSIKLPEELPGIIPTKTWRKENLAEAWVIGNTLNAVIGHGYILTTPLQLAILTSRIASGRMIIPSLKHNPHKVFPTLSFADEHLELVKKGMFNAINDPRGTAYKIYRGSNLEKIAGKTGTAQVVASNADKEGDEKEISRDPNMSDHALFVGYNQCDNPKYALAVVLEHGGGGGNAARLARKIFEFLAP